LHAKVQDIQSLRGNNLENLLTTWLIIGAVAVAGYFIVKHLILRYMAGGGHFSHRGSDGIAFSSDGVIAGDGSAACGDSGGAACGDGGGGGGGGGD
jgi:hypothetical protein